MLKKITLILSLINSGCAIYPLNREYDARIQPPGEMTFNAGGAIMDKKDRFRDSLADLPKPFIAGYKYGTGIPKFVPFSKYLNRLEIGMGGIPVPFIFTVDAYIKYNFLQLPTHTFLSLFGNIYSAGLVSEYMGYCARGGGILTQEFYRGNITNVAVSTGLLIQKYEFAFYEAVDTKNEPDNISRHSEGIYIPISAIMRYSKIYIQCSMDYRISENSRYTISVYPEDTKPIAYLNSRPNVFTISVGYRFKSIFK